MFRHWKIPPQPAIILNMDKILVVNHDRKEGTSLAERLRQEGYLVIVAANETEALDIIHTKDFQRNSEHGGTEALPAPAGSMMVDFIHQPDFAFGPFRLVFTRVQLLKEGRPIPLSYMECKLLMYLVIHRDTIVSTHDLMRMVWGYGEAVSSGTIYTHVSWLRKKLKTPQMPGGYISTVRNMGYIFSEAQ